MAPSSLPLFLGRIRTAVTLSKIGQKLPRAFLLVRTVVDQVTEAFDGLSVEL
jgi:hypothetical protein